MGTNVYVIRENPFPESEWDTLNKIISEKDKEQLAIWIDDYIEKASQHRIHIGKRSRGWKFRFNHNNWKYYGYRLETIIEFLSSCYKIVDEYNREMGVDEFIRDFVLCDPTGFDGESYAKYELNRARLKAEGHPDYQSQFISSVNIATIDYDCCKRYNWYMTTTYNGEEIPKDLPYFFSDSTEFS